MGKMLKNGQEIIIRKAIKEDSEKIIKYMSLIGRESDNLTFGDNEWSMTIDEEEQFIESINRSDNSIMIVGIINDEIVGINSFNGGRRNRIKHIGEFGISVRKSYWNLGVDLHIL